MNTLLINTIIERENTYRSLIRKAKNYRDITGKPSETECKLLQKAADIKAEIIQLTANPGGTEAEKRSHEIELAELNMRISQIKKDLTPEKVKPTGNSSSNGNDSSKSSDYDPDEINTSSWYVSILERCNLERINVVDENSVYSSINGVLYSKDQTLLCYCPNGKAGAVTIPDTVSEIGGAAFSYCKNLKSVVLPNSVETIGECAFGFSNISSISIPNSVLIVGKMAFSYCENLSSVTFLGNSVRFDDMVFEGCENLTICGNIGSTAEQYANRYSIPFKAIGSNIEQPVFEPISNKNPSSPLTDFKIKSVKGEMVLKKYLGNSESVLIPEIVTKIGDSAFFTFITKKIKDVTIVGGVKSIGLSAFACCYNLERVSILDSVISIGNLACSSEKRISTPITNFRMESYNGERTIRKYVGKEEIVCIPDGVTSIGKKAFQRCTHLKSIVIPDTVTRIGNEAFSECTNLKSAKISSSVTAIGDAAFSSCMKNFPILITRQNKLLILFLHQLHFLISE